MRGRLVTAGAMTVAAGAMLGGVIWRGATPADAAAARAAARAVAEGRYEAWVVEDVAAACEFRRACDVRVEDEMGLAILSAALRESSCARVRRRARAIADDLLRATEEQPADLPRRVTLRVRDAGARAVRELDRHVPPEWRAFVGPVGAPVPGAGASH